MARIRIYLDGTFEATAGKYSFATDKERRDRVKVLQGDLKIMDKVEKLRVDRERNKKTIATLKGPQKEKARAKDKEFLGKIKELKAKLTSPRHSSSKIIGGMIRQTLDTVVGGKTIGQIAKEAGIKPGSKKPGKAPSTSPAGKAALRKQVAKQAPALKKAFAEIDAKDAAENEANLTLKDQKILKSLRAGLKSLEYTQSRTKPSDEHYAARKADIREFKDKIKDVIAKGAKRAPKK